ncbi:MAG: nucleotide-binding protein [Polyangiaceae bacterium]|nr:nucleotide-binding protein [Polyangiaceae bacterium]
MTKTRSLLLPAIAVVGGALAAMLLMASGSRNQAVPVASPAPVAAAPAATTAQGEAPTDAALSGYVLERIAVQRYTYLRIGPLGSEGTWAAVPAAEVPVGEHVRVRNAQRMTDFQSTTLKRTFPTIYFGELDTGDEGASAVHAPAAAPGGGMGDRHGGLRDAPAGAGVTSLPGHHMAPQAVADPVAIGEVPRAPGPLGRTVAQIYAERAALAGKKVRVRGVVVKAVANVLDRTFVHLRDGTGSVSDNTHDLTVTTSSLPDVGDRLLYEGTLTTDKDYGSGYRYQAVLEDAYVVAD